MVIGYHIFVSVVFKQGPGAGLNVLNIPAGKAGIGVKIVAGEDEILGNEIAQPPGSGNGSVVLSGTGG